MNSVGQGDGCVLVTGGTGFIGGRLVELLARQGVRVRVVTSELGHGAGIARLPVEVVKASLSDHDALTRATIGCNVVVHAAYRFGGSYQDQRVNFDGTRALAEAFLKNGGRRFVHVSSMTAYGEPRDGDLSEESLWKETSDPYSVVKHEIDQYLLGLHRERGLPVTILQPAIVYGPRGRIWTTRLLEDVRTRRVVLPANGLGLCNAVYIDDVVAAMMLAMEREAAVGETFLISGDSPVTWREFFAAYEKMQRVSSVIVVDDDKLPRGGDHTPKRRSFPKRLRRALAKRPALRQRLLDIPPARWVLAGGRSLLPMGVQAIVRQRYEALWDFSSVASNSDLSLLLPDDGLRALYISKVRIRIDKAREKLGYKPAFDIDTGMARTAQWARSANLLTG